MEFDLVSKLAYFNTTPASQWSPKDKKLFYDIGRIISTVPKNSEEKRYVQTDNSMESWTRKGRHMRKTSPPNYLEKTVIENSELNKFKIIHNPDTLTCKTNETRLVCIRTKEQDGVIGAYFMGLDALEEKLDEFYSKKK